MDANDSDSDQECRDQERSNTGKEYDEHAQANQAPEGLGIRKRMTEDDKRLIRRTEQVEEEPCREKTKEDQQGNGVGEEGNCEYTGDDGEVVDAEVGVVLADTEGGIRERLGLGEGSAVNELGPGSALREAIAERIGEVAEEGTERRSGDRRLGLDGGGRGNTGGCGDGGGGGLRIGDGKHSRRRGCHFCMDLREKVFVRKKKRVFYIKRKRCL